MGYAMLISLLAGLFTAVGGAAALVLPAKQSVTAAGMGFAGGVMVTVSLADLLPEAVGGYLAAAAPYSAAAKALSLFCLGAIAALLLGEVLPESSALFAKSDMKKAGRMTADGTMRAAALRSATVTAAVVMLHNLPEGILTLFSGYTDRGLGATVALAIGLHNLPEGVVIAAPVLYATGDKTRAFGAALLSGLAEPAGAVLAFVCLHRAISPVFMDGLLCIVAGMMCAVSWKELLPLGYRLHPSACALGAVSGCVIMCAGIYCIS